MFRSLCISLILLCSVSTPLTACSCSGPPTFCQSFGPSLGSESLSIFAGRPIAFRVAEAGSNLPQPLVDIVVIESLRGAQIMAGDTITFVGQDGFNCALPLSLVDDSLVQIFGVNGTFQPAEGGEYAYPRQQLFGCGVSVLEVRDGMVFGPIAPGIDSLEYNDFRDNESFCIAGPAPEGCFCITQVIDFCDEVASFSQNEHDLGILRLEVYRTSFNPAYDSSGYFASMAEAVIREVLLGDEFMEGDTVSFVRNDYDRGCSERTFADDVLWAYTDVDYTDRVYTTPFDDLPVLVSPGCSQNTENITRDSVVTLQGLIAYDDYLVQLAECVPALSIINLEDEIDLKVFPNPTTDQATVTWRGASVQSLDLLDARGRRVLTNVLDRQQTSARVEVSEVPPGIYFLRLMVGGRVATRKLVVW